jgi:hypothetical protein
MNKQIDYKSNIKDSLEIISTLNDLIAWVYSNDFKTIYEYYKSNRNYNGIDSKIASIVRNHGFSTFKEFEVYVSTMYDNYSVKQLQDSLKSFTRERINKINKEQSQKND